MERLLLHERTAGDGAHERTWLEVAEGALFLHVEGETRKTISIAVFDAVMRRYGKPLAEHIEFERPCLEIEGRTVGILRHRARYDVIAKDYVVYGGLGGPPLAELATAVTAALTYLLRRQEDPGEPGAGALR
jgi:hypothetical protein